jgi:hypothetical protein
MDTNKLSQSKRGLSKKGKVLFAALLSIFVIIAAVVSAQKGLLPQKTANQAHQAAGGIGQNQTDAAAEPVYHKKQLVFKRIVDDSDRLAVRLSANSSGYQTLASVPQFIVAQPQPLRTPQFLLRADLNNYQALSTLGTQPYYSHLNVQQFLNNLSSQQYLTNLQQISRQVNYQQTLNNLNAQQYLSNLNFQQQTQNLNFQLYLADLNTRIYQNNLSNQAYLNNFNLNTQTYLNNWNTFSNPTYYQPHFYTPPIQSYTPPMQFYTPPIQFYNPPTFNTFP